MDTPKKHPSRRKFIKQSATAAAGVSLGMSAFSAASYAKVQGANDRIQMGFIGIGNRGTKLLHRFMANDDVEVAALCDVYEPYLKRDRNKVDQRLLQELGGRIPEMGEDFSRKVGTFTDFRNLLDMKKVDAVCIATPDHWHAIQTILAIDAGKDVYVEKPLTITVEEGRKMVQAQQNSEQVVAVGLNRRGSSVYQELATLIPDGTIGSVSMAKAGRVSNMYPNGIGNAEPTEPPAGFDWDMWVGPREFRKYQYNIAPYKFRWWKDYSSQMGNWGVHYMDVIRWLMDEKAPSVITAHGSKNILSDDRTIPDTMEVTFEFESGGMISFGVYEASSGRVVHGGEVALYGTKGNLLADEDGYEITPSDDGQFQDWEDPIQTISKEIEDEDSTSNLIRNFLDCVKSREEPLCSLEDGHRSTTFAHLANISLEAGQIRWDPEKERITNNEKANDLLHYQYRNKWDII